MYQPEEGVNCDMGPSMVTNLWSIDGWDADCCEGCKYCDYCQEMDLKRSGLINKEIKLYQID